MRITRTTVFFLDIGIWLNRVKPGGLIGGDDYSHSEYPGVVKAVDEAFGVKAGDTDARWMEALGLSGAAASDAKSATIGSERTATTRASVVVAVRPMEDETVVIRARRSRRKRVKRKILRSLKRCEMLKRP